MSAPLFAGDFETRADVESAFGVTLAEDVTVLVGVYWCWDWTGAAFVLFEQEGKLYEVHGSHCSCHGLAGDGWHDDADSQWKPEETTLEAILARIANHGLVVGSDYEPEHVAFNDAFKAWAEARTA